MGTVAWKGSSRRVGQIHHQIFIVSLCLLTWLSLGAAGAPVPLRPTVPQASRVADEVTLPFIYDPPMTPIPVIPVSINGEPPLPFMLDTGFSAPVLVSTWAAKKLKLPATGATIPAGAGHAAMRKTELRAVTLFGDTKPHKVDFGASDGYIMEFDVAVKMFARPRVAGIIGAPLLASSTIMLDFSTKSMTVFASRNPPSGTQVTVLPMTQKPDGYFVQVSSMEGVAVDLLVDTGSTATNFPLEAASRLRAQATMTEMWLSADGSLHFSDTSLFPALKMGGLKVNDVVVGSVPPADVPKIGLDILSRFRITLDFAKSLLILERPKDYARRVHLPGTTGIRLVQLAGKCYAESVEAGSEAEREGVRIGDRFLAVGAQQLDQLPISVAQHVLDGLAGTTALITVQHHDGRVLRFVCTRKNEFLSAHRLNLGLTMEKPVGGPLVIVSVDGSSPAAREGLLKSDLIVTWNGHQTASMTPEQFRTQVRTPKIALVIKRGTAEPPRTINLNF